MNPSLPPSASAPSHPSWTRRLKPIVLPFLLACGGLVWWLSPSQADDVAYLTEPVRRGTLTRQVMASGEVAAVDLVSVGAQVSGQIKKLHVRLGDRIRKGDPIAEIDSVPQVNQLNIDKAKLQSYLAQLNAKRTALKIARTQFARVKTLRRQDAASREAYESAQNALALAEAEVTQLESQVTQTRIAVDNDTTNLGYTHITAPLDGTVVSIPVDEGQTVNANQTTPTIVQVADLSRMEIRIEISEGDIGMVRPGIPIAYTILSEPERTYHATLTSIDPGLTTLTNGTYKSTSSSSSSSSSAVYFYGKARIDNEGGPLRIGMTAQTVMDVATVSDALLAPIVGVRTGRQGKFVSVLNAEGRPERRPVTTGINDGVRVEILSGLQEGDKVVTAQVTRQEMEAELKMRGRPPRR